jgi:hypothetical protein
MLLETHSRGREFSGIARHLVKRGIPTLGGKKCWQPRVIKLGNWVGKLVMMQKMAMAADVIGFLKLF